MRYAFITDLCKKTVKTQQSRERKRTLAIDRVLTHKFFALPIFFGIMLAIFWLTFGVIGVALSDRLALVIDAVTGIADRALTVHNVNKVIHSLIIDGIFAGVGSVLGFLPLIIVLFFFMAILEDTGYMARVAYIMDKLLRCIGLSGKSLVPMIIGFGCSVPAIMATRTLPSERDRKLTILLIPFMSCTAKIPIYAVFCATFFRGHAAIVMILLYSGGILLGILFALLMKKSTRIEQRELFIMELPNYRLPSFKSVAILLWEKAKDFVIRAFTVIFLATVIIWFLQTFDMKLCVVYDTADSILAMFGRIIAPIFEPLGFGDWRAVTSLISGFSAKEAVISTLNILMRGEPLECYFTPLSAISFLVFTLLYTPCVAAISTIKKELGSGLQTLGIVIMQCGIAWMVSFVVYRIGMVFLL